MIDWLEGGRERGVTPVAVRRGVGVMGECCREKRLAWLELLDLIAV